MSWRLAGIIIKKEYDNNFVELVKELQIQFYNSANGFTFSEAISRKNEGTAIGIINGNTFLFNHFLIYGCSFEGNKLNELDNKLLDISKGADLISFIFDGIGGWYSYSYFSKRKRIRCWASDNGNIQCNEGILQDSENKGIIKRTKNDTKQNLPSIFDLNNEEEYLFSIIENFGNFNFQEWILNKKENFEFFL